jgi:SAM-dependent methyltransferase
MCAACDQQSRVAARQEILELLEQPAPYLGEKQLYQPIELEEYADWTIVRPDSKRRAEIVTRVLRDGARVPSGEARGRVTYLDVGCNTGYFCHHLRKLGFNAEGIDVAEREIKVARLLDSFVRRDFNVYTNIDAYRYLQDTHERLFDVTSAFSVFQWLMVESLERGIACLERLFAKTKQCCFLEMGYAAEPGYKGRLPDDIDRAWVRRIMDERGMFSEIRVYEAQEHGLMRDLFVGIKPPHPV